MQQNVKSTPTLKVKYTFSIDKQCIIENNYLEYKILFVKIIESTQNKI